MKKKVESSFIVKYRDIDPYTGHIDYEGVTCTTETVEQAETIIAALIEYNINSKQGIPNRQYTIKEVVAKVEQEMEKHWWKW